MKIAPTTAQAGRSRICSGPTTNRAACGTTSPTNPIVPTIETIVAVIIAVNAKRMIRAQATLTPSEAAASSPKAKASSTRA
ncbi:hypothetical protein D3C87_2016480 [compost metagenome]